MKKIPILAIGALLVAQLSAPVSAQTNTITPVAVLGTNAPYFSPASPFSPESLAVDQNNNCYLGDQKTGNIYKVTTAGAVSLFATKPGPANGGGQRVHGLKFDCAGNLCVCGLSSETNYNGIFKVSPDGTVTAFSVGYSPQGQNDMAFDQQGNGRRCHRR